MRRVQFSSTLLYGALLCVAATCAAAAQAPIQHAPDGRSFEHIDSIEIPSIPNAPFTAVVVTEVITILPDSSRRTVWNHRTVARDSSGRVFQERRAFAPNGNTKVTPIDQLQYDDPNRHERMLCSPNHVCQELPFKERFVPPPPTASLPKLIKLQNGFTITNEGLGVAQVEGVDSTGSREILNIPAGAIGNERQQDVVKEFWYSSRLGVNLITKRFDPRISQIQNFTVTQVNLADPDPKLFELPRGYKMSDTQDWN